MKCSWVWVPPKFGTCSSRQRKKAPCIVFIDEIDAIGKKRDGQLGGNDEREQTLNQLLTEMDGFEGNTGVIILAATNRPESLGPALTRPGRFDRRVPVELPDLQGREAILRVHAQKVWVDADVDFNKNRPHGFGRIRRRAGQHRQRGGAAGGPLRRPSASQADLEESIEVVIAGYQKKKRHPHGQGKSGPWPITKSAMPWWQPGRIIPLRCRKIIIIPARPARWATPCGWTRATTYLLTKEEIENKIATLPAAARRGDRVQHRVHRRVQRHRAGHKLARAMVTRYGMSRDFDMVAMETVNNQYLGGDSSLTCSAETQTEIDRRGGGAGKGTARKGRRHPHRNREKLDELARYLYEKETITGEEFMQILDR